MSDILSSIPNILSLIKASNGCHEKLALKTNLVKDEKETNSSALNEIDSANTNGNASASVSDCAAKTKQLLEINSSTPRKVDVHTLVWAPLNAVKGKKHLFCARQIEGSELASARGIEFPLPDGHIPVEIFNLPKKYFWKYYTVPVGKVIPYYESDVKSPGNSATNTAYWNPCASLREGMISALKSKCTSIEANLVVDEIYKTAEEYLRLSVENDVEVDGGWGVDSVEGGDEGDDIHSTTTVASNGLVNGKEERNGVNSVKKSACTAPHKTVESIKCDINSVNIEAGDFVVYKAKSTNRRTYSRVVQISLTKAKKPSLRLDNGTKLGEIDAIYPVKVHNDMALKLKGIVDDHLVRHAFLRPLLDYRFSTGNITVEVEARPGQTKKKARR